MYEPCIISCFMTTNTIQYNTIHSDTQSHQLFQQIAQPLCVSTSKRKVSLNCWYSGKHLSMQNKWPNCTYIPRSNDQISLRTDDITHDIRTRVCNIPPPSLFSLGKDKKVVLSMNSKSTTSLVRYGLRWRDGFHSLQLRDSTESCRRVARSPASYNDSLGFKFRPTHRLPQLSVSSSSHLSNKTPRRVP